MSNCPSLMMPWFQSKRCRRVPVFLLPLRCMLASERASVSDRSTRENTNVLMNATLVSCQWTGFSNLFSGFRVWCEKGQSSISAGAAKKKMHVFQTSQATQHPACLGLEHGRSEEPFTFEFHNYSIDFDAMHPEKKIYIWLLCLSSLYIVFFHLDMHSECSFSGAVAHLRLRNSQCSVSFLCFKIKRFTFTLVCALYHPRDTDGTRTTVTSSGAYYTSKIWNLDQITLRIFISLVP